MQEVFRCLVIYPPVNIAMDIHLFHWEIHSTNGGFSIAMLVYRSVYIIRYLEHKRNPCFDRKRPCFFWGGQVTFKNRGHLGSRYIYMSTEPLGFSSQTTLQARSWRSLFAKVRGRVSFCWGSRDPVRSAWRIIPGFVSSQSPLFTRHLWGHLAHLFLQGKQPSLRGLTIPKFCGLGSREFLQQKA